MRKLLTILFLMITLVAQAQRQQISYIEETKNWYYVYDEKGKKMMLRKVPMTTGRIGTMAFFRAWWMTALDWVRPLVLASSI